MEISLFAFEVNVASVREGLFEGGGAFSKPKAPTVEKLSTGLGFVWRPVVSKLASAIGEGSFTRYFYTAELNEARDRSATAVNNSFIWSALSGPREAGVSDPRVFPFSDMDDKFVISQVRQILQNREESTKLEIGVLYVTDMARALAEEIFKEVYLEFSMKQKGELHLFNFSSNGLLNVSLANIPDGALSGSLAGEVDSRMRVDDLKSSNVSRFLMQLDIGPTDEGLNARAYRVLTGDTSGPAFALGSPQGTSTGNHENLGGDGIIDAEILGLETKKKGKFFKVEIINSGAEYLFGVVSAEAEINALKDCINNGELRSEFDYVDADENECNMAVHNIDLLFHAYGPEKDGATISVTEYSDEYCEDEIKTIIETQDANESGVVFFTNSHPDYDEEYFVDKYSDDSLLWGNQKIEKRIHFPAVAELDEDEDFELTNVFVGSLNTDETIGDSEIVDSVYYIRPNDQINLLKEHNENNHVNPEDYGKLGDCIDEIILEKGENSILNKFKMDILDVEGKGEWENDYSVVRTLHQEVIFEGKKY
jgi:hypothetical protein